MNEKGECGSVAFLQHIKHAVSVARRVMEDTPHVMLAGEGALQFALAHGFEREELLTPESEAAWREWLEGSRYEPAAHFDNHDTIGMIALDASGTLSGGCSTSGMAFKMHGRVGDSPIIGAALFVDDEVGAACATGHGELVMRTVGSFLVVELMRQGLPPREACRQAIGRIVKGNQKRSSELSPGLSPDFSAELSAMQVGYLAVNKRGEVGAYSLQSGFDYAVHDRAGNQMFDAGSWL
jgi:N4-(beta-N-acetylglucosaminyl)-L-asparaginase